APLRVRPLPGRAASPASALDRADLVDLEAGFAPGHAGARLATAHEHAVVALHHLALAFGGHRAQVTRVEVELQHAAFARGQVHALEAAQGNSRQALDVGEIQVQL